MARPVRKNFLDEEMRAHSLFHLTLSRWRQENEGKLRLFVRVDLGNQTFLITRGFRLAATFRPENEVSNVAKAKLFSIPALT